MSGDNSNEDDLTFKLQEFLKINQRIIKEIENSDFKNLEDPTVGIYGFSKMLNDCNTNFGDCNNSLKKKK